MRTGVVTDIHSNLEALTIVLDHLQIHGAEKYLCTGDIVGYGPNPNECITLLKEIDAIGVAGNHDRTAIGEMDLEWYNENAKKALVWTQMILTEGSRKFLQALPLTRHEKEFEIVHGSLRNPLEEYVQSLYDAAGSFELMQESLLFIGHTHIPSYFVVKKDGMIDGWRIAGEKIIRLDEFSKAIVNVGGVGQPRDGDPRTACGIFDSEENTIEFFRLAYPFEKTQQKMRQVGLPEPLMERLMYGV